ncbi:mediator complex protein-domain-containing protein [Apiosordaria backusii]|uniref:Mediator of RNA polymerase II transcription subunit 11 n=1 Tax=Apiosordaria backusii TaxID=314023 RepID=A0AA40BJR5_9PEZI|nr:mediator complex protein-domain-containing protein [Apiosordaria backusii]
MNNTNPHPPNPNPHPNQQQPQIDIHTPFTLQEHFTHLATTERDITSLLTPLPQEKFKSAQELYFRTIDRISKHLDRQIYALEEANILTLSSSSSATQQPDDSSSQPSSSTTTQQQPQSQPGGGSQTDKDAKNTKGSEAAAARLDPDGAGNYGKLDVGRLNLASSTTERDVEAEVWERVKAHFAQMTVAAGAGNNNNDNDRMQE